MNVTDSTFSGFGSTLADYSSGCVSSQVLGFVGEEKSTNFFFVYILYFAFGQMG
jgi:hypothetical protein